MFYFSENPTHTLEFLFSVSFPLSLLTAAATDLWHFRISNRTVLFVLAGFPPVAILAAFSMTDWLTHAATALALFAVGAGLFSIGVWGGGDAKLLPAVALWLGPSPLPRFILVMSAAGGAISLLMLALRWLPQGKGGEGQGWFHRVAASGQVPYGVAIAVAGLDWWLAAATPLL